MNNNNQAVITAFQQLLPPLVRLAIANGLDSKVVTELVKRVFVDVVTEDFGKNNRPTNIARTALLSGLSRAETKRLRSSNDSDTGEFRFLNHGFADLIREWHTHSDYIDTQDKPLEIPLEGTAPSLQALAKKFFPDIPFTTVLKELKITESISIVSDSTCKILNEHYIPGPTNPADIERFGEVLRDFAETIEHNHSRTSDQDSRIEFRTHLNGVGVQHSAAFRKLLEDEATKLARRVDVWLRDKMTYETGKKHSVSRMGFGLYQIQKDKIKDQ